MFPDRVKHATHVYQPSTIEVKSSDRRSAGRRQTKNQCEVIAPDKVLIPRIPARMKYRYEGIADGIRRGNSSAFVLVAA